LVKLIFDLCLFQTAFISHADKDVGFRGPLGPPVSTHPLISIWTAFVVQIYV